MPIIKALIDNYYERSGFIFKRSDLNMYENWLGPERVKTFVSKAKIYSCTVRKKAYKNFEKFPTKNLEQFPAKNLEQFRTVLWLGSQPGPGERIQCFKRNNPILPGKEYNAPGERIQCSRGKNPMLQGERIASMLFPVSHQRATKGRVVNVCDEVDNSAVC